MSLNRLIDIINFHIPSLDKLGILGIVSPMLADSKYYLSIVLSTGIQPSESEVNDGGRPFVSVLQKTILKISGIKYLNINDKTQFRVDVENPALEEKYIPYFFVLLRLH